MDSLEFSDKNGWTRIAFEVKALKITKIFKRLP